MEAKNELASEVDTEQEEKVIELGDASQETRGGPLPGFIEIGGGWWF